MRKFLPLFFLLALLSCKEPLSREYFVPGEGPYEFSVSMTDTSAVYDLDFYTRVDAMAFPPETALEITWTAPSDSVFRETVYLPLSAEVYAPYRKACVPSEYGVWKLTVAVPEAKFIGEFRGLGLVVKRSHGTR